MPWEFTGFALIDPDRMARFDDFVGGASNRRVDFLVGALNFVKAEQYAKSRMEHLQRVIGYVRATVGDALRITLARGKIRC